MGCAHKVRVGEAGLVLLQGSETCPETGSRASSSWEQYGTSKLGAWSSLVEDGSHHPHNSINVQLKCNFYYMCF